MCFLSEHKIQAAPTSSWVHIVPYITQNNLRPSSKHDIHSASSLRCRMPPQLSLGAACCRPAEGKCSVSCRVCPCSACRSAPTGAARLDRSAAPGPTPRRSSDGAALAEDHRAGCQPRRAPSRRHAGMTEVCSQSGGPGAGSQPWDRDHTETNEC